MRAPAARPSLPCDTRSTPARPSPAFPRRRPSDRGGHRRTTHLVACALVAGALGAGACSSKPTDAAARHDEAVPVKVAAVERKDVPVTLSAIGTVEPYSTVTVKSQIEGQLAQVVFREGQEVHKGDLLFVVDPRPFEAALRQAEANLARDRVEAENAAVEEKRFAPLLRDGVASKDEYDQARTHAEAMRAAAAADEAAVERARLELQYCSIRSPIDGRVGEILVHEGNVVKENDTTLAVVNQLRPAYVDFSVPQEDLPEVRRRMAAGTLVVAVRPEGDPAPITGELRFVDNTVDVATGTIHLKALFTNDDETLWPGQFVTVAVTLSVRRDAVTVPAEAVQAGQQGPYVFIVKADRTVEIRPVTVAMSAGADAVIGQGLAAGETVVTDGQLRLAPGMTVATDGGPAPS
jgi:membrane fusion protein, multidrug efflux system